MFVYGLIGSIGLFSHVTPETRNSRSHQLQGFGSLLLKEGWPESASLRKRNMSASLFCQTCGFAIPAQATSCAACGAAIVVDAEAAPPPVQTPLSSPAPTPPLFAAPTPAVCSLPAGYLLAGRYRILQQIGQGGFATVYKAQDRGHKNRLVAIKQIHLKSLSLQEMIDASDGYNREVTHLSSLRHQSLPRIYDYFTDDQHWYIAMEYLTGKTLEERLKSTRRGFLPVKRTLDIGLALCDVFHYLHTQHPPIIFRDIKPANIIITRSAQSKKSKPPVPFSGDCARRSLGFASSSCSCCFSSISCLSRGWDGHCSGPSLCCSWLRSRSSVASLPCAGQGKSIRANPRLEKPLLSCGGNW